MKFLSRIRTHYAKFTACYWAPLVEKYNSMSEENQQKTRYVLMIFGFFVFYIFIHHAYVLIFGHHQSVPKPMVIRHGGKIEIPDGSPLRAQIELKTVALSSSPHLLNVPAWVEAMPKYKLSIFTPVGGRLVAVPVNVGDLVHKGQVLMSIRSADFAAAYSDYKKALSAYTLASAILKRATAVNQVGGNTFQAVQEAQNDALQAKAELKRSQAYLKILSQQLSSPNQLPNHKNHDARFSAAVASLADPRNGLITLTATMHGHISHIAYAPGAFIHQLDNPIIDIVSLDKVWVTAAIPENAISKVHPGQAVKIRFLAYPDRVYSGKIDFIHPGIDADTHRNLTRIVLSNPDHRLQPNMYASVDIYIEDAPQILIPLSSVLMNNESTVVYVETAPWVCQRREVELGSEDGQFVRVLSGLKPGERIVTCGGVFINDK